MCFDYNNFRHNNWRNVHPCVIAVHSLAVVIILVAFGPTAIAHGDDACTRIKNQTDHTTQVEGTTTLENLTFGIEPTGSL